MSLTACPGCSDSPGLSRVDDLVRWPGYGCSLDYERSLDYISSDRGLKIGSCEVGRFAGNHSNTLVS